MSHTTATAASAAYAQAQLDDWLASPMQQAEMAQALDLLTELCAAMSARSGFQDAQAEMRSYIADAPEHLKEHYENIHTLAELMLQVSELGEAAEAVRKPGLSEHIPFFSGYEEELADEIVRTADNAGRRRLSLGDAVVEKLLFNATRPRMHGKKA